MTQASSVVHFLLPFYFQDLASISPYCLPYKCYDVSPENLTLDQPLISSLIFFFILITCLLILYCYCKENFCPGYSHEAIILMKLFLCLFAINLLLLLLLLLWLKNTSPDFRIKIILPGKFLISVSWQCPFLFPSYSTVIISSSCFPTTGSQLYSSTGSSGKTWGEWWSFLVSFNCWLVDSESVCVWGIYMYSV